MPLEKRAAFKLAFLATCAEAGLTLDETHAVVKQALAALQDKQASVTDWLSSAFSTAGRGLMGSYETLAKTAPWAVAAGAAAIPVGGYMAGSLAGSAVSEANDRDISEVKLEEKLEAYRRETERAKIRNLLAAQRREGRQTGRPLLV